MKLVVAAVGTLKRGPELVLIEKYQKLLPWKLTLHEIEVSSKLPSAQRMAAEAEKLRAVIQGKTAKATRVIALDSRGTQVTSDAFARLIEGAQNASVAQLAFIIGGQDGIDPELLKTADHRIAFGNVTWPHMLARVLLFEQIYRAHAILSGHPYHAGH
jgi:23S rRNA (pseudouridine1915-N3)-methyltransferase